MIFIDSAAAIVALFALYGVFYAIEESPAKAFIAGLEAERRATAVGLYNFVTGSIYLPASLLAGGFCGCWHRTGHSRWRRCCRCWRCCALRR